MKLHERFKKRVREALHAEDISQAELARRMRVSSQMVSNYLSHDGPCPSLDVIENFATALGIEDGAILIGSEKILQLIG